MSSDEVNNIYQPLSCLQEAGDIIYLPSQWIHLTMNIGETIAIGGQELLRDEERFENAQRAFNVHPHDPIVLKGEGVTKL
jgi:hypothetical protein